MTISFKSATCFTKEGKPRSTYYSETSAEEGAAHVKYEHGLDMVVYKCPNPECGYWHLTPRERQTPSHTCHYCTDSCGKPKQLYETLEAAKKRARIILDERKISLDIYECPHSNGYHLTHA